MIDELFKAADAMTRAEIPGYDWHFSLSSLPSADKTPCLRIWLLDDGHIKTVEWLPDGLTKELWKFEPNNGFSLPGFNYSSGKLKKIFGETRAELEKRCNDNLTPDETLGRFFNALKLIDPETFQNEFEQKVRGVFDRPTADKLLSSNASVFLDITDCEYPVASQVIMRRLNELLWLSYKPKHTNNADPYNPKELGLDEPFPRVLLPSLKVIRLRSQVEEVPAQTRYDRCESKGFPLGLESRKRIKRTLEWLSAEERISRTFGIAGKQEILFAYPSELPAEPPELAECFCGSSRDDESTFADIAASVIGQLKGQGEEAEKDVALEIFSLRKMDQARTKVVYYRNTSVDSLEAASRDWDAGFKNIPLLTWNRKDNKGKTFSFLAKPQTLFPVKLHKILNTVWTLSSSEIKQSKVKLFEPSTGLRLLLDTPEAAHTAYVMERFLSHSQTYFVTLCRAKGRDETTDFKNLVTYPGVFGLLLYKLGKTKEHYMNESAFQLGRFLRVADEIHRLYCEVVRPDDRLPELCGSSLLIPMLESPLRTFNQLTVRVIPYLKWVKRFRGQEESRQVRDWMDHWTTIVDKLYKLSWPTKPSPEERAQIFLGYLSSFPKSENETTEKEGTL